MYVVMGRDVKVGCIADGGVVWISDEVRLFNLHKSVEMKMKTQSARRNKRNAEKRKKKKILIKRCNNKRQVKE